MASFDELQNLLITRLHKVARQPTSPTEFDEQYLIELLQDETGPGIASQVVGSLFNRRLLRQTRTDPIMHEITPKLIMLAETQQAQPSKPMATNEDLSNYFAFKEALLVGLAKRNMVEGLAYRDLKLVADERRLKYQEGWVRKAAESFRDNGYINSDFTFCLGLDEGLSVKITGKGIEAAEELRAQLDGEPPSDAPSLIPASDRYVEIDDNSPDFKDAKAKVESAAEAIRGYNEPTNYDKEQVVSELTIGQQLFKSVKVRVGAAIAVILAPLYTVYNDTAAVALRSVVEAAIDAVKVWLGL